MNLVKKSRLAISKNINYNRDYYDLADCYEE